MRTLIRSRLSVTVRIITTLLLAFPSAFAPVSPAVAAEYRTERIAGADRIGTAIEISKAAFPQGSDTVIIATGYNFPDALAGAPLACVLDALSLLGAPTSFVHAAEQCPSALKDSIGTVSFIGGGTTG